MFYSQKSKIFFGPRREWKMGGLVERAKIGEGLFD
jgi:hypothetical protein